MAFIWFICFAVAAGYAYSLSKKVSKIEDLEQREARIKEVFAQAHQLHESATKKVEVALGENKVFHAAIEEIVNLWVNDSWKSIVDKLTASNHATQKGRMEKVFETCRKYGIEFDGRQERAFYVRLETEWKKEVENEKAREEQNRIKEIMREEQRAEKVRAAELKKLEEERKELEEKHQEHLERIKILCELQALKNITEEQKKELDQAMAENAELEKELEEKERRKAMAELTKAGNVYVISNIGSFGDKVFKVGMTRRLIPEERIKELGDASVPFPFDCHMMIPTEDAPALESKLHEELWKHRMNLVNDGKEFFRIDLQAIKQLVDKHCKGAIYQFQPAPAASQWRESEARRKENDSGKYDKNHEIDDESSEAA